jgi:Mg2+ and Co2+ transporter CorA
MARPTVPGYYWQHIAYVVIWFLMAVVTLYLPFYQRRRTKLLSSNGESDG